jgi:hypothetical protein
LSDLHIDTNSYCWALTIWFQPLKKTIWFQIVIRVYKQKCE